MAQIQDRTLSLKDLTRPEMRADPYPFYAQLREHDPIHWDEEMGFWALSRYADIARVYASPHFSRARGLMHNFERLTPDEKSIAEPLYDSFARTLMYSDPPSHTRLRAMMSLPFGPHHVRQMKEAVAGIVDELLDKAEAQGGMDLVRELAHPLPVLVIADLIGLPRSDWAQFKTWSDDLFAVLGTMQHSTELLRRAADSLREMNEYILRISRGKPPGGYKDLISYMTSARRAGAELSEEEMVANISVLLGAGHETTSNLIGTGILRLLQHPEQMQRLCEEPSLIENAVEEMLRYESPVQIAYRAASHDFEIGGRTVREGQIVNLLLGAGNRDPKQYPDPDQFDITRRVGRHLAFGMGIHFCLGSHLVRLEASLALEALLRRFPSLRLETEDLDWQTQPIFRGLLSLPVSW